MRVLWIVKNHYVMLHMIKLCMRELYLEYHNYVTKIAFKCILVAALALLCLCWNVQRIADLVITLRSAYSRRHIRPSPQANCAITLLNPTLRSPSSIRDSFHNHPFPPHRYVLPSICLKRITAEGVEVALADCTCSKLSMQTWRTSPLTIFNDLHFEVE